MQFIPLKRLLGTFLLLGGLMAVPMFAYAKNSGTFSGVVTQDNDIVHLLGAEVTSVSGNIINAMTRIKNATSTTWSIMTNATTTVHANNSMAASTTDIRVGDRLHVMGRLASSTSTNVAASVIMNMTTMGNWRVWSGTVQSVSTSTGSFVMRSDNRTITVQTGTSTVYALGTATSTLSSLALNSKVYVAGAINPDGTNIAAHIIMTKNGRGVMMGEMMNYGFFQGLKNGWSDMQNRDYNGMRDFMRRMMGWDDTR